MSTIVVLLGQYITVGQFRKRAGIEYPQSKPETPVHRHFTEEVMIGSVYAEKAEMEKSKDAVKFNCAQRM